MLTYKKNHFFTGLVAFCIKKSRGKKRLYDPNDQDKHNEMKMTGDTTKLLSNEEEANAHI